MSYGLSIRNQDNVEIIGNTLEPSLRVIESGVMSSGVNVGYNDDPNAMLFVRPSTAGASIWGTTTGLISSPVNAQGYNLLYTSSGTIDYVKLKLCSDFSVTTGYGLVVYDNGATPLLVFSDAMRFILGSSSFALGASGGTISLIPNLSANRHKYISAFALGPYTFSTASTLTSSASFSSDGSSVTLTPVSYPALTSSSDVVNGLPSSLYMPKQINIIEC